MRRTNHEDDRSKGLSAALKVMAVVLAVGALAVVAGQSAYKSGAGAVASPKYQVIEPAPDDAPYVAANPQGANPQGAAPQAADRMGNDRPHLLAAAPAGVSPPEMQSQESARPKAAAGQDEEPVATF